MLASQLNIGGAVGEVNWLRAWRSLWPRLPRTWRARSARVCLAELQRRSSSKLRGPHPTYTLGSNVTAPIRQASSFTAVTHGIVVNFLKRRQRLLFASVGDCGLSDQTVTMGDSRATQPSETVVSCSGVSLDSISSVPVGGGADWLYLVGQDEQQISTVSRLRDEGALRLPDGLKLWPGRGSLPGSYAALLTTEAAASRHQSGSHVLAIHQRKKCEEGFEDPVIGEMKAMGQHCKEQFAETAGRGMLAKDRTTSVASNRSNRTADIANGGPSGDVSSKTSTAGMTAVPKGLGAVSTLSISHRTPRRSTESLSANEVYSVPTADGAPLCLLQERQQNTFTDRAAANLHDECRGFQQQAAGGVGGRIRDDECDSSVAGTNQDDRCREGRFDVPHFFSLLSTSQLGKLVVYAHRMPSTQTFLLQNANCLPEGTVCVADLQMLGKGRGGSVWESPEGCLMFSFTQTATNGRTLPFVQYVVTLAVVQGVESLVERLCGSACPIDLKIKWPNDIYASGLKIGGVLCNSSYRDRRFNLVIGVGLNVSNRSPTICLNELLNAVDPAAHKIVIGKERLLAAILTKFEQMYSCFKVHGFGPLKDDYHSRWLHTGQRLTLQEHHPNGGERNGGSLTERGVKEVPVVVKGLSENGFLLAVDESGDQVELHPDGNSLDLFKGLVRRKVLV
ncbi:hypothetical protein CBR_g4408 [Chara braunii]|uniref:BPL/LPL catalytic domain-containing protein n=1 Tax=Chara braunii TaxID=69332 RepID=A0A388KHP3_CHABU|nr:hypothetical protein CBR_g4408 [Chara braunii]|eukprot:GBG69575.1 hypothetical protein CBR_g4408 [Chara braunii]